jgi:hypothetical protein
MKLRVNPPLARDRNEVIKIIIDRRMPLASKGMFIGILEKKAITVNSMAGIIDINIQNLQRRNKSCGPASSKNSFGVSNMSLKSSNIE